MTFLVIFGEEFGSFDVEILGISGRILVHFTRKFDVKIVLSSA